MINKEKPLINAVDAGENNSETPVEWNAENEIQLFYALEDMPIVGINKHFNMSIVVERLAKALKREEIHASHIWAHLNTLYDLKAIEIDDPIISEEEFSLPDAEFASYLTSAKFNANGQREQDLQDTSATTPTPTNVSDNSTEKSISKPSKEMEKKIVAKLSEPPKRVQKRTRGSMSLESNSSPSTTPPPPQSDRKRRRI